MPSSSYERRIANYLARHPGASRSEARGHGSAKGFSRVFQQAVKHLAEGRYGSATEAARVEQLPVERFRNYIKATRQGEREGGGRISLKARKGSYHVPVISEGQVVEIDTDYKNAKLAGQYMAAVKKFIRTGNDGLLRKYGYQSVVDIHGQNYPLETDPRVLTDIYSTEDIDWDEIYRRNG